jgi:hypothetical protein
MVAKTKKKAKVETEAPANASGTATPGPEGQAPQNDLSIGDLRNLSTVIDVASTRGAFRANEMAMVGAVYNKLQAFLAKVAPPKQEGEEGAPATPPTPDTQV